MPFFIALHVLSMYYDVHPIFCPSSFDIAVSARFGNDWLSPASPMGLRKPKGQKEGKEGSAFCENAIDP